MKVSIVVPLYNKEKYINKCVKSILDQTLKEIEIIIIDDGSTDNSVKIIKELQKEDDRIKLFSKENGGLSSARNYGINKARGKYIGFVDADDTIGNDMYKVLYDTAEKSMSDITMCSYAFEKENEVILDKRLDFIDNVKISNKDVKEIIGYILNMKIDTGVCIKLFKLELLRKNNIYFDEKFKLSEDYPFTIKAYLSSNNNCFISKPLYYYMLGDDESLSRSYDNSKIEKIISVYNEIIKITRENNLNLDTECKIWLINNIRFMTSLLCKKYKENYVMMKNELNKIAHQKELNIILNELKCMEIIKIETQMKLRISNSILLLLLKSNNMNTYAMLRKLNNIIKKY